MAEAKLINSSEDERRRHFRIDDYVELSTRRLDQNNFDDELARFEEKSESVCFSNSAELEQEKLLPLRRSLETNYPDIAEYLTFLESRIDTLSKIVLSQNEEAPDETQKVNISAQGIRFYSEYSFPKDELVELLITLKPSNNRLLIIGTVVWSIEDPNVIAKNKHAVAVDFTFINEADREVLVKHIQNKTNKKNLIQDSD